MRVVDQKWVAGLLILGIAAPAPSFADTVGHVVRLNPIVSVLREGKTIPLKIKDEIHLNDVIQTDGSGKVQVFFRDDSSVSLGSNSKANMKEFVQDGSNSRFQFNMTQGIARVITGKIVKNNPKGFAVNTPEATVGIRGTILVVNSANGQTTVYVEQGENAVYVNGIVVPPGFRLTLPAAAGAEPTPERMTDTDRENIEAASRVASNRNDTFPNDRVIAMTSSDLSEIPLAIQTIGDDNLLMISLATPSSGAVTGTLSSARMDGPVTAFPSAGTFSFDIDLKQDIVSNATMNMSGGAGAGSPQVTSYTLTGGSGSLAHITNFTGGSITDVQNSDYVIDGAASNMKFPGANAANLVPGNTISGTYEVKSTDGFWPNVDSGSATGTLQ